MSTKERLSGEDQLMECLIHCVTLAAYIQESFSWRSHWAECRVRRQALSARGAGMMHTSSRSRWQSFRGAVPGTHFLSWVLVTLRGCGGGWALGIRDGFFCSQVSKERWLSHACAWLRGTREPLGRRERIERERTSVIIHHWHLEQ